MTYIVNDKCIKCKLMDCVDVCPVDCIYEVEPQEKYKNLPMFIHVDECIDCNACEPACPVDAIRALDEAEEPWITINEQLSEVQDDL